MTSDSISTRPRIRLPRISPAALGLRAMPSTAALRPLACDIAPNAAAIARAKPPVMIAHLMTSVLPLGAVAACWACSGEANPTAASAIIPNAKSFLLTSPPEKSPIRQFAGFLHCPRDHFAVLVLFVLGRDGATQIDGRQQHED